MPKQMMQWPMQVVYVIQKSKQYGLKQFWIFQDLQHTVVYVIQKSKQYGLKQWRGEFHLRGYVVYVIQKSKQYGLKQYQACKKNSDDSCVCHSKK